MNIIFLTISRIPDVKSKGIYTDLMRKFRDEGHNVYIVTPNERRYSGKTSQELTDGVNILRVKTLNLQKTNIIEKGIGTISIEYQFLDAIKKHYNNIEFDLILYSTPPITFSKIINYLKSTNKKAKSYLLLKDIFPQNAVDLGVLSKINPLYWYFRKKEKILYSISDYIGCMSPANVSYILRHNKKLKIENVEVAPNSIDVTKHIENINCDLIKKKYDIPLDKMIFVYGGNIGKPQGVDFIIECLKFNKNKNNCHFVIVGSGTEYYKLAEWQQYEKPHNFTLIEHLDKSDYDNLVQACDVGLIFLDYRFTIPNFPSRLLNYLEFKKPIIVASDPNSDLGEIAAYNKFGLFCNSNDVEKFSKYIDNLIIGKYDVKKMGDNGYNYLISHYQTQNTYNIIISHLNNV